MRISFLTLLGAFLLGFPVRVSAAAILQPGDRVAICGDALTNSQGYSDLVEDYLLGCQPVTDLNIKVFGSSNTAHDFLARLNTDFLPFKPTVALLNFGMMDDPKNYRQSLTDLVEALKKAGVRTIVIGSPHCVDSQLYQNSPANAAARNATLSAIADMSKDVAAKEGMLYADVFGTTMAAMKFQKAKFGDGYVFDTNVIWEPREAENFSMAYAFLKAMGFDGDIGTLTIDFATGKTDATAGHKIISYQDNKATVESTILPFAFTAIPSGEPDRDLFASYIPFNADLNRLMLVVKNLPTDTTKILWNDENYDFSSADLAKGVNLAATTGLRCYGTFQNIAGRVCGLREMERIAGDAAVHGKADPQADQKREAAFQDILRHRAPVQYSMTIQPLAPIEKQPAGPIPVTVDTDMSGDCDDVGALALLDSFMCRGEANLIACVTNTRNGDSGAVCQAINAYYGHPSIPIGSYQGEAGPATKMTSILLPAPSEGYHGEGRKAGSHYTVQVHKQFDPDFPTDDKLPAGVDIYRKALASAPDGSVVMCSIGGMENFQDLIQSQPDSVSPLNGIDLVKKKVRQLVVMANTNAEDKYLLSKWPTQIVWTTFVGSFISAGKSLQATPDANPVKIAYGLFGDNPEHTALKDGRNCWDLTAAWLAVKGAADMFDEVPGYWRVNPPGGYGTWIFEPKGRDRLAIQKMSYENASKIIDAEVGRPPKP